MQLRLRSSELTKGKSLVVGVFPAEIFFPEELWTRFLVTMKHVA